MEGKEQSKPKKEVKPPNGEDVSKPKNEKEDDPEMVDSKPVKTESDKPKKETNEEDEKDEKEDENVKKIIESKAIVASNLTNSITKVINEEGLNKFSDYDNATLTFSILEKSQFPVNADIIQSIEGRIPTLFNFVSEHKPEFADSNADNVIGQKPVVNMTPTLLKSVDLIKDGTFSVRLEFEPTNYPIEVKVPESDNLFSHVLILNSRTDATTTMRELSRRLISFFRLTKSFSMRISKVTKGSLGEMASSNPVYKSVINLWEGDNPHPYLGLIYHPLKWFGSEIERIHKSAPLDLDETSVISDGALKVESVIHCIVDQFTSRALFNTKNRLDNHILTGPQWMLLLQSHCHPKTGLVLKEHNLGKLYKYFYPDTVAWNVSGVRLMLDTYLRNEEINKFVTMLVATKMFDVGSTSSFFAAIASNGTDTDLINDIFPAVGLVDVEKFCRMLLLEEFAWSYNITFTSGVGMSSANALSELMSMMLTFVFFPKIVQAGSGSYGYRMMQLLSFIDVISYGELLENHGAILSLTEGGVFIKVSDVLRPITVDEMHAGYIYSIFSPKVAKDNKLPQHFRDIATFFNKKLSSQVLVSKRTAKLPYSRANYISRVSHDIDINEENSKHRNSSGGRCSKVAAICQKIVNHLSSPGLDKTLTTSKKAVLNQALGLVQTITDSANSLFFTMASVSHIIRNSYIYVHDGYEPAHPMVRPQFVSLGPYFGSKNINPSVQYRQEVVMDCRVGLGCLISVSGGTQRPTIVSDVLNGSYTLKESMQSRTVLHLDPVELSKKAINLAKDSVRFGEAMQILSYISMRMGEDDPVFKFTEQMKNFFHMHSFSAIVDAISTVYNTNLSGILKDPRIPTKIGDFRTESLSMTLIDRRTSMAVTERDSIFGSKIVWADKTSIDNVTLAGELALSDYSPILQSSTGLVLYGYDSPIISPKIALPPAKRVIEYSLDLLKVVQNDRDMGVAFMLDGREIQNPRSTELNGLHIRMRTFGDLAIEHIDFLVKALMYTSIRIEATEHKYSYSIKYITERKKEIYTGSEEESLFREVLNSKNGQYLHIEFRDTTYDIKTNTFKSSSLMKRGLIFPSNRIRSNEVISGIYGQSKRSDEFTINNGDQFGFGSGGGTHTPISGIPKLSADANMNNPIPVYSSSVEFDMLPEVSVKHVGFA